MTGEIRLILKAGKQVFRFILAVADHQQTLDFLHGIRRKIYDFLQCSAACIGDDGAAEGFPKNRIIGNHIFWGNRQRVCCIF